GAMQQAAQPGRQFMSAGVSSGTTGFYPAQAMDLALPGFRRGPPFQGGHANRLVAQSTCWITPCTALRCASVASAPSGSKASPARGMAYWRGATQHCRFSSSGFRWLRLRTPPSAPGEVASKPTTLPSKGLVPLDQFGSPLMGLETQSMVFFSRAV